MLCQVDNIQLIKAMLDRFKKSLVSPTLAQAMTSTSSKKGWIQYKFVTILKWQEARMDQAVITESTPRTPMTIC